MISRIFRALAGSATCAGTRPATKEDPGRTPDPTPCQFSGQPDLRITDRSSNREVLY